MIKIGKRGYNLIANKLKLSKEAKMFYSNMKKKER